MEKSQTIRFQNEHGKFRLTAFVDGIRQCLLIQSETPLPEVPLVRVHSSCVTSEVLGMLDCDCSQQLRVAFKRIHDEGGLILYSEAEGRGAGIIPKLNALRAEATTGIDSHAAYVSFGLKPDSRDYSLEAEILKSSGINEIRLLTNNMDKVRQLSRNGLNVIRVGFQL